MPVPKSKAFRLVLLGTAVALNAGGFWASGENEAIMHFVCVFIGAAFIFRELVSE